MEMVGSIMDSPIIMVDTREKKKFQLEFYGFNTISKKVQTGDYAILGKEDFLAIDRKASVSELASNLFEDYTRFKKEMIRMSEITHSFLILEFPLEHVLLYPHGSNIPRRKWVYLRATPSGIYNKLDIIHKQYGVKTIFHDNRDLAEQKTVELLNLAIEGKSFDHIEFFVHPPRNKDE